MLEYKLFIKLLDDDMINLNAVLIKYYRELGIDEKDIILLSMFSRQEARGSHLFVPMKMQEKIGLSKDDFYKSLDNLTKKGYLSIKVGINTKTNKKAEFFYLDRLYEAVTDIYLDQIRKDDDKKNQTFEEKISDLYEKTFMRQMTPIDVDIIRRWASEGKFNEDEIKSAMLDAAKAGKISLKYVDSSLIKSKVREEENPQYEETSKVIADLKEKWKKE